MGIVGNEAQGAILSWPAAFLYTQNRNRIPSPLIVPGWQIPYNRNCRPVFSIHLFSMTMLHSGLESFCAEIVGEEG
jgi:hypothetical protein